MTRWARLIPTLAPALVVGVVALAVTLPTQGFFQPGARRIDGLGLVLLLLGPAALAGHRRYPTVVLAVAAAGVFGYFLAGYPFSPAVFLATIVALAVAVGTGHRRAAYLVAAVTYVAMLALHVMRHPGSSPLFGAAAWLAWLVAVIAGAEVWRARGERLAQDAAVRRAEQRRRGSEERLALARDLHDVLGHHVSLINVQAGVALYLMDDDPEQARQALATIKRSSGDLLREMRAALGVLRGVDEAAPRRPTTGLAGLRELVADSEQAGLPVALRIEGAQGPLPAGVDLAAYRIVQEALTNSRRHARATRATVLLRFAADALTVRVDDDGRARPTDPPAPAGNGVPGMRERAGALGGTLTAGPRPDGGFRVHGELPLDPAPAAADPAPADPAPADPATAPGPAGSSP